MNRSVKIGFIPTSFKEFPNEFQGSHLLEEPLDLMYCAGALNNYFDCKLVQDLNDDGLGCLNDCDILVFSTTNSYLQYNNYPLGLGQFKLIWEKVQAVENFDKIYKVVIGPHVIHHKEELLQMGANMVFSGEAEMEAALHILNLANNGKAVLNNYSHSVVSNLDDLPCPAYSLTSSGLYRAHNCIPNIHMYGHLYEASRGCPYKCSFCNTITHRRQYRTKSPRKIYDDLSYLCTVSSHRYVYFIDESFAFDYNWFLELSTFLKKMPLHFGCQANLKFMNLELLDLMKECGFVSLEFGFESASEKILRQVGKDNRLRDAAEVVNYAASIGLNPLLFLIFGLPGETKNTIEETVEFLYGLDARVRTSIALPTAYPGTGLYKKGVELGVLNSDMKDDVLYEFNGQIGHDLMMASEFKDSFLSKYGPNNYLTDDFVIGLRNDLAKLFT